MDVEIQTTRGTPSAGGALQWRRQQPHRLYAKMKRIDDTRPEATENDLTKRGSVYSDEESRTLRITALAGQSFFNPDTSQPALPGKRRIVERDTCRLESKLVVARPLQAVRYEQREELLIGRTASMDTPSDQKARLRRVTIDGLFGRYSHDFHLAESDHVTILHGPNGVGKTAMLRLLFAIFSGRPFQALTTKFQRLTLRFEGSEMFEITRRPSGLSAEGERIEILSIDRLGLESRHELGPVVN